MPKIGAAFEEKRLKKEDETRGVGSAYRTFPQRCFPTCKGSFSNAADAGSNALTFSVGLEYLFVATITEKRNTNYFSKRRTVDMDRYVLNRSTSQLSNPCK